MYNFGGTVNSTYHAFIRKILDKGEEIESPTGAGTQGKTKELHPVGIEIQNPEQPMVSAFGRPINVAFALAEVIWILNGMDTVHPLSEYNSRISQWSDDGQRFNAAYGKRFRREWGDQLGANVDLLQRDPLSRQAVIALWHPEKDHQSVTTKDRACNVLSHLMVRNNKLDWLQIVRSNDALWGTPYNWMQWMHIQKWMAMKIGVGVGNYQHIADSLHIYEHHWVEAERISYFNVYDYLKHREWGEIDDVTPAALASMESETRRDIYSNRIEGSPYWYGVGYVLRAHYLYKRGRDEECVEMLCTDADPVYGAAALKFYWWHRWGKVPGEVPHIEGMIHRNHPKEVYEWITEDVSLSEADQIASVSN